MTEQEFEAKWSPTHIVERVYTTDQTVVLDDLTDGQSVAYGDGKTFYYLLTKK